MITEKRFTQPVTHYRSRRRWKNTMQDVCVLLVLSLLIGWIMSCVGAAAGVPEAVVPKAVLERAQTQQTGPVVVWLLVLVCTAVAIGLATTKQRENEKRALVQGVRKQPAQTPEDQLPGLLADIDGSWSQLVELNLIEIIDALLNQTEEAARWLYAANCTLSFDEAQTMTRLAELELEPVLKCLPKLKQALEEGRDAL